MTLARQYFLYYSKNVSSIYLVKESWKNSPCVAHAYTVIYVTEKELEELVGQDTRRVCEAKERVIRKHSTQAHGPGMKNGLIAQTA